MFKSISPSGSGVTLLTAFTNPKELDITPAGSSVKNDPVWPLNAPDIAVAVNTGFASRFETRVLNDPLDNVNDPVMLIALNGDDVRNELVCALVTKFAELDNTPDGNSVKNELVCALVMMPISLPNPSANVTGFCVVSA